MASAADRLADAFLTTAINVQRFEAGVRQEVIGLLFELEKDIERQIRRFDVSGVKRTSFRFRRAEALLKQVRESLRTGFLPIRSQTRKGLIDLASIQANLTVQNINNVFGASVLTTSFTRSDLRALVSNTLIHGTPLKDWWAQQQRQISENFAREVRLGVAAGEPTPQIVRRIIGSSTGARQSVTVNGKRQSIPVREGGIMNATRRNATTLVRTSINAVSNQVMEEVYRKNQDVLAGHQLIVTLDSRTCFYAGSSVVMGDNTLKPIEKVRSGDFVLSGSGVLRRVCARKVARSESWRVLRFAGGEEITCTPNHPFWTRGGWVEAQALKVATELGLRAVRKDTEEARPETLLQQKMFLRLAEKSKYLRSVWSRIPSKKSTDKCKVLLSRMLFDSAFGVIPSTGMSTMWKKFRGERNIRATEHQFWSLVFESMYRCLPQGCSHGQRVDCQLRNLWEEICAKTGKRQIRQASKTLLQGLPKTIGINGLCYVWNAIRAWENTEAGSLFSEMLLAETRAHRFGANGHKGTRGVWDFFLTTTSTRKVQPRFLAARPWIGYRSRRGLLASNQISEGTGPEEESSCSGAGLENDSHPFIRTSELQSTVCVNQEATSMPNGWKSIVDIKDRYEPAFCYDLEIEQDHSFLVTQLGVIAHNSNICIARSGGSWDFDGNPLPDSPVQESFPGPPPYHPRCRSLMIPVMKEWEEMVADSSKRGLKDVSRTTQSSIDGQVAADLNYEQWLRTKSASFQTKVLGPGRKELWEQGKISLTQLIDQSGRPLTLEQLGGLVR